MGVVNSIGDKKKNNKAAIDHDHKTGIIRGLLCGLCNMGLGSFRDNPEHLASAILYLNKSD